MFVPMTVVRKARHRDRDKDKESRTRLDVDERRAQLLALGVEHFGRMAYDDVSIDAIAQAAGISKGLLYHYFPTKKAFYAATVREAAEALLARTDTAEDLPPLERLGEGLDAYLDFVREHAAAYATLMKSGVGVDPDIAAIVDQTRERFIARLTDGITRINVTRTPLLEIALRGWVGLCEHASLAWTEGLAKEPRRAPPQAQVRMLLANALMALISEGNSIEGADVA
jgi:AcrR family transcriptional regulator